MCDVADKARAPCSRATRPLGLRRGDPNTFDSYTRGSVVSEQEFDDPKPIERSKASAEKRTCLPWSPTVLSLCMRPRMPAQMQSNPPTSMCTNMGEHC